MVKSKMFVLEELIEYEILISEFYNGDYHITLDKAVEFTSQAKEYIEKGEFDKAVRKIEFAEDLAKKVLNLSNFESNDLKSKVENRMRQMEILFEYCNRLYFDNDFTDFSLKLKELFQQARVSYENARAETKRREYISAQDSISFAVDCLLSAMKISADELFPLVESMLKEKILDVDDLVKNDIDSILQNGNDETKWYFNQGLRYRDMAEKDIQKNFVRSYEMIQLSIGYCRMALEMVRDKNDDATFIPVSKFEQNKIEKLEIKNKKEYDFIKAYEKLWQVKNNLSYQDPIFERVIISVNRNNDLISKIRLKRLMDFKKLAEVSLFLEDNQLANTFQYCAAKLSYKILEISNAQNAKRGNSVNKQ